MFDVMKYQTCNWTALTYLESFDHEELCKRFRYANIPFTYIVHDKDTWKEGDDLPTGVNVGDLKKPHIHWCVRFPSKKSGKVVCTIFERNRVLPMRKDLALDYRYLCHLDDPDKYQYQPSSIVTNEPEVCEPYLYDLQNTCEVVAYNLLESVEKLYYGIITYHEFYSMHPDMMRKAVTVDTLIRQLSRDYAPGQRLNPRVDEGDGVSRQYYHNPDPRRPRLSQDVPEGTF